LLGAELELEVGPVAHGGHCVARHEGRVVFVRHALPGEQVLAMVTEDHGGSFCRADAITVLRPSADRVPPPCPHAGPGRCGGCDWQHASAAAQRELKAAVVREQLARLAGLPDVPVVVTPVPGGTPDGLLGWRTRLRFAVDREGRTGLRRYRSHHLELVEHCPLGTVEVNAVGVGRRCWPGAAEVEVVASTGGDRAVTVVPRRAGQSPIQIGPPTVREQAAGREWRVSTAGFWQVHPAAADSLATAVLDMLRPQPGESAVDLYAGAGLFAGVLAAAVAPSGRVLAVEGDRQAAADARGNLAGAAAEVEVRAVAVTGRLVAELPFRPALAVLDPPPSRRS
jgi:tRNA/tmRNA/rRNA uracil-C5-methylase (TrmA/RlmC/RlmD family)